MWVPLVENREYENDGADYFIKKNLNNKIKDITVINGLTKLNKLSLKGNNLDSFKLNKLTKLEDLNLANRDNQVKI